MSTGTMNACFGLLRRRQQQQILAAFVLLITATVITTTTTVEAATSTGGQHHQQDHGVGITMMLPEWTTPLKEGDRVPDVTFFTRTRIDTHDDSNPFDWKLLTSGDYFSKKRVVLFALPGAFTPTCSSTHLPGYVTNYDMILDQDVDEVYCLSVNDAFVMRQWGLHQGLVEDKTIGSLGFEKVKLIPDGSASFTRGMGMSTLWDETRGFGERSWRYSMVVDDGVIEKLFIEQPKIQNSVADPFEISDAGTMLAYLKEVKAAKKKDEL